MELLAIWLVIVMILEAVGKVFLMGVEIEVTARGWLITTLFVGVPGVAVAGRVLGWW